MADALARFLWLDHPENTLDDIFCVSFFRGLTPTDVLRRFGPGPGEEMAFHDLAEIAEESVQTSPHTGGHVGVVQANGWSVAVEPSGWYAATGQDSADFTRGCEMIAISRHDYAEDEFLYVVDGEVIIRMVPIPGMPSGRDPNRLNWAMRKVGMPTGDMDDREADDERLYKHTTARAFALAAEITGVPFTRDLLTFPLLVGPVTQHLG